MSASSRLASAQRGPRPREGPSGPLGRFGTRRQESSGPRPLWGSSASQGGSVFSDDGQVPPSSPSG